MTWSTPSSARRSCASAWSPAAVHAAAADPCAAAGATPGVTPASTGSGVTQNPGASPSPESNSEEPGAGPAVERPERQRQQAEPVRVAEPVGVRLPVAGPAPPTAAPSVDEPLKWMNNPDQASIEAFQKFQCPPPGQAPAVNDDPDKPLVTCDEEGIKYLLSAAIIEGTQLTDASFGIPAERGPVRRHPRLQRRGRTTRSRTSPARIAGTGKQFAIVLDGVVISAPTASSRITRRRPDQRRLQRGRGQEPRHQPEVRRAADQLRDGTRRSRPSGPRSPVTSSPPASPPASSACCW